MCTDLVLFFIHLFCVLWFWSFYKFNNFKWNLSIETIKKLDTFDNNLDKFQKFFKSIQWNLS